MISQNLTARFSYLNCFGMQFLLLLNNLLLQTADLLFEVFNLTFLFTVWTQFCVEFKTEIQYLYYCCIFLLCHQSQISKSLWRTGLKVIRVTPLHVTLEEEGIEEGFIAAWTLNGKEIKSFISLCIFQYRSKSQNKKNMQAISQFRFWVYSLFKFAVWLSIINLVNLVIYSR